MFAPGASGTARSVEHIVPLRGSEVIFLHKAAAFGRWVDAGASVKLEELHGAAYYRLLLLGERGQFGGEGLVVVALHEYQRRYAQVGLQCELLKRGESLGVGEHIRACSEYGGKVLESQSLAEILKGVSLGASELLERHGVEGGGILHQLSEAVGLGGCDGRRDCR